MRWAESAQDLAGAIAVREQVFCREQGDPLEEELDGRDEQALHVVALDRRGRVIATLRLLFSGETAKIGRVAVQREWRRQGIAARMLELGLQRARAHGGVRAEQAAQLDAVGLYEQAGFVVESDTFDDAGIPHVWMGLALTPPPSSRMKSELMN